MGWYHTAGTSRVKPPTNTQASPPDTYLRATFHPKPPASALSQRRVRNTQEQNQSQYPLPAGFRPISTSSTALPSPGLHHALLHAAPDQKQLAPHLALPAPLTCFTTFSSSTQPLLPLKECLLCSCHLGQVVQRISMSSPRLSLASWQHSCTFWEFTSLSA